MVVSNSERVERALSIAGGCVNLYGSFGKNLEFGKSFGNVYTILLTTTLLGIYPKNIFLNFEETNVCIKVSFQYCLHK